MSGKAVTVEVADGAATDHDLVLTRISADNLVHASVKARFRRDISEADLRQPRTRHARDHHELKAATHDRPHEKGARAETRAPGLSVTRDYGQPAWNAPW